MSSPHRLPLRLTGALHVLPAPSPSLPAVQWFLAFLTLTMIGFGLAFYALFRQDRQFPDFANLWHSFASMFSYMVRGCVGWVSISFDASLLTGCPARICTISTWQFVQLS